MLNERQQLLSKQKQTIDTKFKVAMSDARRSTSQKNDLFM